MPAALQNIGYLLAAAVGRLFRRRIPSAPRRILIIQPAKLGDMICTTPLFRAVKEHYPDAELFVVGNAINAKILLGNPHIDRYLARPDSFRAVVRIVAELRPDFACITAPDPGLLAALLWVRVPQVATPRIEGGFSPYATKIYRIIAQWAIQIPHRIGTYAPREYLRLLEPIGIHTDDTRKELVVSPEALYAMDDLLHKAQVQPGTTLVGISPGVGNKRKRWGGDNFATVAAELLKRPEVTVVVVGGPADREDVAAMLAALPPSPRLINTAEQLSLEELKALISRLALFVAVDTGPIYIAEAFNVPTVDIVGPMDEREQPPRSSRNLVVIPPGRPEPLLHIMNASDVSAEVAYQCTRQIRPAQVLEAIQALLPPPAEYTR